MEAKSAALSLNSYLYNQFDNKAVEHDMDDAQEETIPTTTESQLKGQPQSVSDKMLTTVKADISQPANGRDGKTHGGKRKKRKRRKSTSVKAIPEAVSEQQPVTLETQDHREQNMSLSHNTSRVDDTNTKKNLHGYQNIIHVTPAQVTAVKDSTKAAGLDTIANTNQNSLLTKRATQQHDIEADDNILCVRESDKKQLPEQTIAFQRPLTPTPQQIQVDAATREFSHNINGDNNNNQKLNNILDQRSHTEVLLSPEILQQQSNMDVLYMDNKKEGNQPFKRNGVEKPKPQRSVSMPTRQGQESRQSETESLSKWRSVKNAVKITTNLAKQNKTKKDSFMEKFNTNRRVTQTLLDPTEDVHQNKVDDSFIKTRGRRCSRAMRSKCMAMVFYPDGTFMFYWLLVLSLTVEYNLWVQILRQAFPIVQEELPALWFTIDALADLIYLLDILVQFRTGYLEDGLLVTKQRQLAKHYVKSKYIFIDVAALTPFDFLYFIFGVQPLLRFPRFIKIYRLVQFLYIAENQATYPNVLRVCNLTHILLLLCHWFAAFYYMISKAEGVAGNWVHSNTTETSLMLTTRQYLKSLYWSTLTLTTIGDLPSPESNWQYLFQILSYLIGVFVFATIVGQVGNSINNYNATRHEYEQLLDGAKLYMRKHDVPKVMQVRVQRWCDYAWTRGRMQGALDINSLKMLPDRLKTELALHVHLDILKQVSIFEDCEPEFLHDLVLKMQTYIFTPGDMVVRKGEIAREMFIIADGHLDVIGDKGKMIARLSTGNFFGEIGILNLDGGINRRTADVKSVGYSELFVLKREDVVRAIKYYPSAKASLMRHAKKRLAEMREQVSSLSESAMQNPPTIRTDLVSGMDRPQSIVSNYLDIPRTHTPVPKEPMSNLYRRHSRNNSVYSIKSIDLDNDTVDGDANDSEIERVRENELIAQLTESLEEKDDIIIKLNTDILQLRKQLDAERCEREEML